MRLESLCAFRLLIVAGFGWVVVGCASPGRHVSIITEPNDAILLIDNADTVRAPADQRLVFADGQAHKILASRFGYTDQERVLKEDPATGHLLISYKDERGQDFTETSEGDLKITLRPKRRIVTFKVTPVPGIVLLDGQPLAANPVSQVSTVVEFHVDTKNNWLPHSVTVKRTGFQDDTHQVQWTDALTIYTLTLQPMRKDLRIITRPPGAEIFINGETRGVEPVSIKSFPFPVDPDTNAFLPQKITAKKPGFDTVERIIGWDNGQTEYTIDLTVKTKAIRIVTDPPGATVTLDGTELGQDGAGASSATLDFAPIDDKGTPKVYAGAATEKNGDTEWEAAPFQVGWDDGRKDYVVKLSKVTSRPLALLRAKFTRGDRGWTLGGETVQTVAPKDVSDAGPLKLTPVLRLPTGDGTIDGLATSPDGSQIVFTTLAASANGQLHSQIQILNVDGLATGAAAAKPLLLGDNRGLALTPSFSPDGKFILFGSDRDGKRCGIWSMPADGSTAPTRMTAPAVTMDLWPSLDSLPHSRLFYQSLLDARPDPRLFFAYDRPGQPAPEGTDLAQPGSQPHVSPQADRVLFAAPVPGAPAAHRRLYTIPDNGGQAAELTHSPYDDFDPAWSKDGGKVAFVSDRPTNAAADEKTAKPGDYNIWVLDLSNPQSAPVQVTANPAWDDSPAWDATGKGIYFRSNRGGTWGIWEAVLK